jgi:hypothetical protein
MLHRIWDSATNRKLNSVVKGWHGVLDRIQVPSRDWYYSPSLQELLHFTDGVFEAYPPFHHELFHPHHTLKILPPDALLADVSCTKSGHWRLLFTASLPPDLWMDITSQAEIEALLLARNQQHLKLTQREGGRSTVEPMSLLRDIHGFNPMSAAILAGRTVEYDLSPELSAFFSSLALTPLERGLTPVLGTISSADFQTMFHLSKERTSSDPRMLNYTL